MIGIVVVGHNKFAEGISSTVTMVAGQQQNYKAVDFLEGTSPDQLLESINNAVVEVNTGEGVLVFTDLKGGSPNQKAIMVSLEHENVHVLAGTNIAMLLEGALMRHMESDAKALAQKLVETGREQVDLFDPSSLVKEDENVDNEDGI